MENEELKVGINQQKTQADIQSKSASKKQNQALEEMREKQKEEQSKLLKNIQGQGEIFNGIKHENETNK